MAGASRSRAPLPADIVVPRVRITGSATLNTSTVTACTDAKRPGQVDVVDRSRRLPVSV